MDDLEQKQLKRLTIADRLQKFFSSLAAFFPTDAEAAVRKAEEHVTPRNSENEYHRINKP
jgi:hypothetical protein